MKNCRDFDYLAPSKACLLREHVFVRILRISDIQIESFKYSIFSIHAISKKKRTNSNGNYENSEMLTGGESGRRAKHGGQILIFQAILSGVSKHCAGSYPTVAELVVVEVDGRRI